MRACDLLHSQMLDTAQKVITDAKVFNYAKKKFYKIGS